MTLWSKFTKILKILLNKVIFLTNKSKNFIKQKMLRAAQLHNKISFPGLFNYSRAISGWRRTSTVLSACRFWVKTKAPTPANAAETHITWNLGPRRNFWWVAQLEKVGEYSQFFDFSIVSQDISVHTDWLFKKILKMSPL